jgi:HlyD family secretion protein
MNRKVFLIALVFLTACSKEKEKEAEPILPVQVTAVVRGPIERIISADGVLRALDQSAIMPKISAPVRKFYVNRGDHVKKGQLLAELESRDLEAAVADTKGAYDQAGATYRNTSAAMVPDEMVKAQQDVQAGKQSLEASRKLLQSREQLFKEGALARRLVDEAAVAEAQARSTYETAQKHLESLERVGREEEVKSAAGQLQSAKGKFEAAEAQRSYAEIRSPLDGVVADRAVFPGEMAAAGSPLISIMDVSSVIARINIPQAQAAYVKIGRPATLMATDGSQQAQGKVTVVSPAIDPNSTTVEIWVQAPNPGQLFRPGGTVHVTITAGTIPDALIVPPAALLPATEGGTSVMVVGNDSVAHEHKVQTGVREPEKVQIVDGVKEGDQVVIAGGVGLGDGAKVKVEKAGEKDKADEKEKPDAKEKAGAHE